MPHCFPATLQPPHGVSETWCDTQAASGHVHRGSFCDRIDERMARPPNGGREGGCWTGSRSRGPARSVKDVALRAAAVLQLPLPVELGQEAFHEGVPLGPGNATAAVHGRLGRGGGDVEHISGNVNEEVPSAKKKAQNFKKKWSKWPSGGFSCGS